MYECKKCGKIFDYPSHLKTHNKNVNCEKEKIGKIKKKYNCSICGKKYNRNDFFKKHVEKCKQELIEKNQKQQIVNNYITNNINNTNVMGDQVENKIEHKIENIEFKPVFNFNLPGNETISHINQERLLEILNHNFSYAMRELMRLTYFNKDVPENSKWCVVYPKDEYGALQYNHETENIERWVTDQIVDENFESMMFLISPVVDQIMEDKELTVKLNEKQKQNLNMFYNYFGIDKLSKENPSDFKNIKMMAYNNRVLPMDLWNKLNIKGV